MLSGPGIFVADTFGRDKLTLDLALGKVLLPDITEFSCSRVLLNARNKQESGTYEDAEINKIKSRHIAFLNISESEHDNGYHGNKDDHEAFHIAATAIITAAGAAMRSAPAMGTAAMGTAAGTMVTS